MECTQLPVVLEKAADINAEVYCSEDVHEGTDCKKQQLLGRQTQF